MKLQEFPDNSEQLAPWIRTCDHKPILPDKNDKDYMKKNDEYIFQINNHPLDNWCDECQASVCRKCFEDIHQYHKSTGREVSKKLTADRIQNAIDDAKLPKDKRGKPGVFEIELLEKFKQTNS